MSQPDERLQNPDEMDTAPLSLLERRSALAVGGLSAIAGTIAVFLSDNQVGTGALFVAAVAFLLIGIQGTPLTKFTSGEHSFELATKKIAKAAMETAADKKVEGQPEAAQVLTDFAINLDPRAGRWNEALAFESKVRSVLRQFASTTPQIALAPTGADVRTTSAADALRTTLADSGADAELLVNGVTVNIEVKQRTREVTPAVYNTFEQQAQRTDRPTLVVTNAPLSDAVMQLNMGSREPRVEVVRWVSEVDNNQLIRAILRMGARGDVEG